MGDDKPPVQYMPFQINPVKRFELDHTLNLVCREEHGIDGSKLNRCILEVTKDKTLHTWRGPVVALRQVGVGYQPYSVYEDITLADLHHAVDYFLAYGAGLPIRDTRLLTAANKMQAKQTRFKFGPCH